MGPIEVVATVRGGRRWGPACRRLLGRLGRATGRREGGITVLLTSDLSMRRLNRAFRGKDHTTDVLSFPAAGDLEPGRGHLGDIAVSLPRAERQARQAGWGLREELALLLVHGYLHLLGHDHETDDGTMRRLEERLLLQAARVSLSRRRRPWGKAPAGAGATRRGATRRRRGRPA